MADFIWKQGDEGPMIQDTLSFEGGTSPEEQGTTLSLRLRSLTSADLVTTTGTAEFVNLEGDVTFTPSIADTMNPVGNYLAEWVVSNQLGQTQTFPTEGYLWGRIEPSVTTAPQLIISPLDVKRYMDIPASDRTRDTELIDIIESITPLVEAIVGPLIPKLYEEWHDGGSNVITLTRDPSLGFGSNPYLRVVAASEYRGPIEYPLALVASPAFGSIYSIMVVPDRASITRRSAGGRTIAFMPGRDSIHIFYESGQNPIPAPIRRAALEYVRTLFRWPKQTGTGSLSPADRMEMGAVLQSEMSRIVNMYTRPMRRFPSIA